MEGVGHLGQLDAAQEVARCIVFPRGFPDGVLMIEQVAIPVIGKMSDGCNGLLVSVAARLLLPLEADAHGFGCRVAEVGNFEKAQKLQRPLIPMDETIHYRGFFSINLASLYALEFRDFVVRVVHWPEKGLDEHCNLELAPKDKNASKNSLKKRSEITEIAVDIASILINPKDHTCPCDYVLAPQLEQYKLSSL